MMRRKRKRRDAAKEQGGKHASAYAKPSFSSLPHGQAWFQGGRCWSPHANTSRLTDQSLEGDNVGVQLCGCWLASEPRAWLEPETVVRDSESTAAGPNSTRWKISMAHECGETGQDVVWMFISFMASFCKIVSSSSCVTIVCC